MGAGGRRAVTRRGTSRPWPRAKPIVIEDLLDGVPVVVA